MTHIPKRAPMARPRSVGTNADPSQIREQCRIVIGAYGPRLTFPELRDATGFWIPDINAAVRTDHRFRIVKLPGEPTYVEMR